LEGLRRIKEANPQVQFVEIPFSDGHKRIRVVAELDLALQTNGEEVPRLLEKTIMLSVIDDKWKNHLREMDELRTSVTNAQFEQKDPLVVYKFEAYGLFEQMMNVVNEQVLSLILKAEIDVQRPPSQQQAPPVAKRDDFSKMKAQHDNLEQQRRLATREATAQRNPNPSTDERPLSRRERREQEQDKKKRR
jgi:preprotein translocase subunit SecA